MRSLPEREELPNNLIVSLLGNSSSVFFRQTGLPGCGGIDSPAAESAKRLMDGRPIA
jgi:hypothetical protein